MMYEFYLIEIVLIYCLSPYSPIKMIIYYHLEMNISIFNFLLIPLFPLGSNKINPSLLQRSPKDLLSLDGDEISKSITNSTCLRLSQ